MQKDRPELHNAETAPRAAWASQQARAFVLGLTLPVLLTSRSRSTALSYGCSPQSKNCGVTSYLMLFDSPLRWNCITASGLAPACQQSKSAQAGVTDAGVASTTLPPGTQCTAKMPTASTSAGASIIIGQGPHAKAMPRHQCSIMSNKLTPLVGCCPHSIVHRHVFSTPTW